MSIKTAITLLDAECEALAARIKADRPQDTPVEFALLRAKSLGRSFLRRAAQLGIEGHAGVDALYKGCRERAVKEDKPPKDEINV
jgi:hypothetical protein